MISEEILDLKIKFMKFFRNFGQTVGGNETIKRGIEFVFLKIPILS